MNLNDTTASSAPFAEPFPLQTRERIIDAAERLFALKGLDGVSIRDITKLAEANVGAINYYFGSKEGLIFALCERRLAPITQERLAALDALEKASTNEPPSAEAILTAFLRPVVQQTLNPKWGSTSFARLLGRLIGESGETIEKLKKSHFDPVVERYDAALLRAIPTISPLELRRRMIFVVGAMHYLLLVFDESFPCRVDENPDPESEVQRLVKFTAAGLRVP